MKRIGEVATVSLAACLCLPGPIVPQEADVAAAVRRTFAALNAGAVSEFVSDIMPRAQLFLHLGYGMSLREGIDSIGIEAWRAPFEGYRFDLVPRDVRVQVYGEAAVVAAYVHGQVRFPSGLVVGGPWRYSETRVRDREKWRIVQQHFSPLGERAARVAGSPVRTASGSREPGLPRRYGPCGADR